MMAVHIQKVCRSTAKHHAFQDKPDALAELIQIPFMHTGNNTLITGGSTGCTGFRTFLVLLIRHTCYFWDLK
jgi:hypothetical protein